MLNSSCVLRVFVTLTMGTFFIFKVSEASLCDNNTAIGKSTTKGTWKRCCKIKHYINRQEASWFYCKGGCCGDKDDEYCCYYTSKDRLPFVIGFCIFGVLMMIGLSIILFFMLREAHKTFKDNKAHKNLMAEAYKVGTLEELLADRGQPVVPPPGTTTHPVVTDDSAEPFSPRGI